MKLIRRLTFLSSLLVLFLGLSSVTVFAQDGGVPIHRLYNPGNSEHFYTPSDEEVNLLTANGWTYEGVGWYAPYEGVPVYRLSNAGLGNHLYTTSLDELNVLALQCGWTVDNNGQPLFYSGGDVAIYRLYNPGLNSLHLLTTDEGEYNLLPGQGWNQEGISLMALRVGEPISPEVMAASVQQQLLSKIALLQAEYPMGMQWSYEKYYTSPVLGSGNACHAFALMASDKLFGNAPAHQHLDMNNIKIGDIVRYRDYSGGFIHSVVVQGVIGHTIACAEGNWGRSVNYGRIQNLDDPEIQVVYICTRY